MLSIFKSRTNSVDMCRPNSVSGECTNLNFTQARRAERMQHGICDVILYAARGADDAARKYIVAS